LKPRMLPALPGLLGRAGAAECRYPGMRCRNDLACCRGSYCDGGACRCNTNRIQCGDFCVSRQIANTRGCCKPYNTRCVFGDPVPCCGRSLCTGRLDDAWVCCGLEFHPCTPETAGYCCSRQCTEAGRCAPVPPPAARK
ncbi:MAG: hypothetical protein ACKOWF_17800, partial [Chloroflexota bacterium]